MEKRRARAIRSAIARQVVGPLAWSAAALLIAWGASAAQVPPCYTGFEMSQACINARGLDHQVELYRRKIAEAMYALGAAYQIALRIINNPVEAGYDAATVGDVFIVREEETHSQSFVINVTADFLARQPEILFEASALHEVCHIMNDDLSGYHRNGANVEIAEEHCVLRAVGESRYKQFLNAYATYRHWNNFSYDEVLQRVKDTVLVPAPSETDEADRIAAEYFRHRVDGTGHLLVYNGEVNDVNLDFTRRSIRRDTDKLSAVIRAGEPIIVFHTHPAEGSKAAMFPSDEDFQVAALLSFLVYRESPRLTPEFRVLRLGRESTIVSYGFKGTAVEEIKDLALEYRNALDLRKDVAQIEMRQELLAYRLARECFSDYLRYACPVDPIRNDAKACRTHPQYFIWPSDRFFVHYRPH